MANLDATLHLPPPRYELVGILPCRYHHGCAQRVYSKNFRTIEAALQTILDEIELDKNYQGVLFHIHDFTLRATVWKYKLSGMPSYFVKNQLKQIQQGLSFC
jgi:hypothetical protein